MDCGYNIVPQNDFPKVEPWAKQTYNKQITALEDAWNNCTVQSRTNNPGSRDF
jgi:hypothetical protein